MSLQYKKIVRKHEVLLSFFYRLINRNSIKISGRGNLLSIKGVFAKHSSFSIKGDKNVVKIDKGLTRLENCKFLIWGNNNSINIESGCKLVNVSFYIEDSNGSITIGSNTIITGCTHLAVIEGKSIKIGDRCLFSQNITLRTGDSHSVLDNKGERINPSKDIVIGDHVWIGNSVTILKGAKINDNSVIATGSLLTGKEFPSNCIVGGIGGKVLKSEIDWCEERIPFNK